MTLVTVGTKYQIVIPKNIRQKINSIKPGTKVRIQLGPKDKATIEPIKEKWSDRTYGLMKDAWKTIDMEAEIEKARDGWDKKD